MHKSADIFEIDQKGDTIIVTPVTDLRELVYQQIEAGMNDVLNHLADTGVKNVVMDFHVTDYFGTTALGCFLRLWKRVKCQNGLMAFCNVSEHEREVLRITKLDNLWPIYSSKEEALRSLENKHPSQP
jgi:anti-sigma B factor antagonist